MTNHRDQLSVAEKIGYSLGDLSANLIFQTLMTFLAFYYTDVYQLSPRVASTIIFTGGITGACFNPIMGIIADRTHTRWGQFRPWVLWTAVPLALFSILTFTTPNLDATAKTIYALSTYICLILVYTANNLPYSALSGVITSNLAERNSLSAYRFTAVLIAQFTIQVLLLPLVLLLGSGDKVEGFRITMSIFAIVGTIFFVITFLSTRERVSSEAQPVTSVKKDIQDLMANRPWAIILAMTTLIFISLSLRGGTLIYYFTYYLNEDSVSQFLAQTGCTSAINQLNRAFGFLALDFQQPKVASASAFSVFNAGGIIFMILGIRLSKPLADKFGKRDVLGYSLLIATLFILVFYVLPPHAVAFAFIFQIFHGFFYGITIPLLWSMTADVADYSEWKNHRRATAIIFSAMIFGLKVGLSIGGSMVAGILAFYKYDASLPVQEFITQQGIKSAVSLFSAIPFFISVAACLFLYPIDKKMESQIETDLYLRRTT
ncbi:MAG: glycoside-pentoside-hexuronide (GPH):cation symporter [Myxococcales bacterium]|nr:glycoside-pentoside-hexuronide (GPH):cation symporter [Myxococcales bacterium]